MRNYEFIFSKFNVDNLYLRNKSFQKKKTRKTSVGPQIYALEK
jgi:hypothetical protein